MHCYLLDITDIRIHRYMYAYHIVGFSRAKNFMNCPCSDFQGENFNELSISLSTY